MKTVILSFLIGLMTASPSWAQESGGIDGEIDSAKLQAHGIEVLIRSEPEAGTELQPDSEALRIPVFEIRVDGKEVATVKHEERARNKPLASARIVEMDGANDQREVVMMSYTGGAHCCYEVQVLDKVEDGSWKTIGIGAFDGDKDMVEDADNDGRFEIIVPDQDFLYAFDSYAASYSPLKIFALEKGTVKDVSREPRFLPRHRAWLEEMTKFARENNNLNDAGFLAGQLGMRIALGEGEDAWRDFEITAKRAKITPVKACPNLTDKCADDQKNPRPFATAVRRFLESHGYKF